MHPDNMCDTYKSRGEDCPAKKSNTLQAYRKYSDDCCASYTYLFKDGIWYVDTEEGMVPVIDVLQKEEEEEISAEGLNDRNED